MIELVAVGGWRAGEVRESVDALRAFVGFTRHHCFVVVAARFLNHLSARAGKDARSSDILMSRARSPCAFARRPARSCGEPSAATEDAAKRYEKVIATRYIVRGQRSTAEGIGQPPRDLVADVGRLGLWDGLASQSRVPSSVPEKRRSKKRKKGGPKNGGGQGRAGIWVAAGCFERFIAKISTTGPSFIMITHPFLSLPTASLRWTMTKVALGCGRHSQRALLVRPLMLVF